MKRDNESGIGGDDDGDVSDAEEFEAAEASRRKRQRKDAVLPWMRVPISISEGEGVQLADVTGMHAHLVEALREGGYSELFPVQAAAWQVLAGGMSQRHDLCVSAPTGSGKTLSYALPVLQRCLASRSATMPRALIVVPTRSLADQVYGVLKTLCEHLPGVTVGLANGTAGVTEEAAMIQSRAGPSPVATWTTMLPDLQHMQLPEDTSLLSVACAQDAMLARVPLGQIAGDAQVSGVPGSFPAERCASGAAASVSTGVSILVATPGRLVHHLDHLPATWLNSLDILIVDEMDRLLRQQYQRWLPKLLAAIRQPDPSDPLAPRTIKMTVSATLSRDPAKVDRLQLHAPRYIALEGKDSKYKLPKTLQEWKVVTSAAQKPVALVALLHQLAPAKTLVFTSSVDATHRLVTLLKACACLSASVGEFSSLVSDKQRVKALAQFRDGPLNILVASDGMTRGMDIAGVQNVVSYDMPTHARTYVHRSGRTARAGASGSAYCLLRTEHIAAFKVMLRKADNNYVKDYKIPPDAWDAVQSDVHAALGTMHQNLRAELQEDA